MEPLDAHDCWPGPVLVLELGQRRALAQVQRLLDQCQRVGGVDPRRLQHEPLEVSEVDLIGLGHQLVAGRPRQDPLGPDDSPQLRHVVLQAAGGRGWWVARPERVGEAFGGDHRVRIDREHRQEAALRR